MRAYDLEILRRNRDDILKAELGAFLHNIGKFGEEFINWALGGPRFGYQNVVGVLDEILRTRPATLSKQAKQSLTQSLDDTSPALTLAFLPAAGNFGQWLRGTEIRLPAPFEDRPQSPYHVGDLIEFQDIKWYRDNCRRIREVYGTTSQLTELLEASHHACGAEKNLEGGANQNGLPIHLATVFGHEHSVDSAALRPAREKLLTSVQHGTRNEYLADARNLMVKALAETRRPLNDITLWDISSAVAAFFKAALAKMLLEGTWTAKANLKWRILRLAMDGPAFYQHVSRLPDLLGRKEIINHGLDAVKELLEEKCPLGNEVYRDEFGSAFVIPDLDGEDGQGSVILSLVYDLIGGAFRTPFEGDHGDVRQQERAEATRAVKLEITPAFSVSPAHQQGLGLADELATSPPAVTARPESVRQWWEGIGRADICTVCGVRPQGHPPGRTSLKAKQRRVCVPCEALRDDRCEEWFTKGLEKTIWLDEVADANGLIALITGRFAVDGWLKPNGYVQSSLVVNPLSSNPSSRFKELTFARLRRISDTTARFWEEIQGEMKRLVPASGLRWRLRVAPNSNSEGPPVHWHAYQLEIPNVGRLAVTCTDGSGWQFITAENLERLARLHETSLDGLLQQIDKHKCTIYEDRYNDQDGYTRATAIAKGTIQGPLADSVGYRGIIPILADPRSFMMLVPASTAGDVVEAVKRKYEAEMARVRSRLPIAVGIVFGEAHTPLSTILDAGRRMMNLPVKEEDWNVSTAPVRIGRDWIVTFSNGAVWKVPAVMEDATTEDNWYTYFLPATSGDAVGVSELQTGNPVKVTPSRFDFQFVDCAATRFELDYSEHGRKRRSPRPYLLERWDQLSRVWCLLSTALATSQIKALQADIGWKRQQWAEAGEQTLATFVRDTLATANWAQQLSAADLNFLTQAGIDGWLEDAIELYMGLLNRNAKEGVESE